MIFIEGKWQSVDEYLNYQSITYINKEEMSKTHSMKYGDIDFDEPVVLKTIIRRYNTVYCQRVMLLWDTITSIEEINKNLPAFWDEYNKESKFTLVTYYGDYIILGDFDGMVKTFKEYRRLYNEKHN